MLHPTDLKLVDPQRLEIAWSDGQVRTYSLRELRESCPCASCRERRTAPPPPPTELTVLRPAEAQPLRITQMHPVGRYAYSIHFSDGHDTGIYTLELLRELGSEA
ncbi:MAG: DUF971 domain-containing protein [Pirellulales bacterium]|nr:DUF971 domain-containing protein [Pirellulales bacterium]